MSEGDVTNLLLEVREGRAPAADLMPLVYEQLRVLARRHLGQERSDHSLQATDLVHEVYLRIVDQTRVDWQDRAHFFAVAAQAMRRILIDHARRRARPIHGGNLRRLSLDDALTVAGDSPSTDLLALDAAIEKLSALEPESARVVELRFFGGLTIEEAATVLGVSPRTVRRGWEYAKVWLYRELTGRPIE